VISLCRGLDRVKRPGLVAAANGGRTRQIIRPEPPGGAGLADLESVTVKVKGWPSLQTRLHTLGTVATVAAPGDVEALGRCDCRGVVKPSAKLWEPGTPKMVRLANIGVWRNRSPPGFAATSPAPNHSTEITGRHALSDADDQPVREKGLPPPELVEFCPVQRRRASQSVVAEPHQMSRPPAQLRFVSRSHGRDRVLLAAAIIRWI
jgi:hypothetical protein